MSPQFITGNVGSEQKPQLTLLLFFVMQDNLLYSLPIHQLWFLADKKHAGNYSTPDR